MNVKDKIMMIMVCSFFGLMFFVVGTEMYLSLKENIQPTTELWTILGQTLTGILGIISGYLIGKKND
tara:strand:+ start:4493 stop:4693 length:201 start_codon:yes stop_codon:yes gene_type:complete